MWRHIDSWAPAAKELGVEILGPAEIDIGAGIFVEVDMLFPQFGPENGMLVVEKYSQLEPRRQDILAAGYGYSVFSPPPPGTYYSADDLAEMLADWTWNGRPEDQPDWSRAKSTHQ